MRLLVALVCLTLLIVSVCSASDFISRHEADEAVRAFEGNPYLVFADADTNQDLNGPEWQHRGWYTLVEVVSPGVKRYWQVDATTGEVVECRYGDSIPAVPTESPFGPLTGDQCLAIAEQFAREKYSQFEAMGFRLNGRKDGWTWTGRGWVYSWRQQLVCGAVTPNSVTVVVNPSNGCVETYSARRYDVSEPSAPLLSMNEAVDVAGDAAGIMSRDSARDTILVAEPGRTYWRMTVSGMDAHGAHRSCIAEVDAQSGTMISQTLIQLPTKDKPKIMVASMQQVARFDKPSKPVMVSARTVFANLGYTILWDQKKRRMVAVRGRDSVILTIGRRTVTVNGREIMLAEAPRLVKDRTQVLSTLVDILTR